MGRLLDPASLSRHRDATELMLLHRRSPLTAEVAQLRDSGVLAVVPAGTADRDDVLAIIARAEGPAAAEIYERWIDAQPAGLYSPVRDRVEAFSFRLRVAGPPVR